MARQPRLLIPEQPYHLTQRGNYRQDVFRTDGDRQYYLDLIFDYAGRYGCEIWGYCLMTNHVHFITFPQNALALARTFGLAHMRYSQYFNQRQGCSGHLWQGRFFASLLDDAYLARAARYVECNPVRAGLVTAPGDWPWSSAALHLRGNRLSGARWPDADMLATWREYLQTPEDPADLALLRAAAMTGRPVGREDFLAALSAQVGHALQARPRGRPRIENK